MKGASCCAKSRAGREKNGEESRLNFSRRSAARENSLADFAAKSCHLFMHCVGSFLLQIMLVSLQIFVFKGQNMKVTVKMLFTCILRCDALPGCDWNCLQVQ